MEKVKEVSARVRQAEQLGFTETHMLAHNRMRVYSRALYSR